MINNNFLLFIPHELLTLILPFLNTASIFALSRVTSKYNQQKIIKSFLSKRNLMSIHMNSISNGHISLFKWFVHDHEVKSVTNTHYANKCIKCNRLDILKYIHENGCSLSRKACNRAAKNGHLEILKYLHKIGCNWSTMTCCYAAKNGHLEILKYLLENGCSWNSAWICFGAVENNHLEIIKYFCENCRIWNIGECIDIAIERGHNEIAKYLRVTTSDSEDY